MGTVEATLEPWGYTAFFDIFDGTVDSGFAVFESASGSARYLAWAEVVDSTSGDPVFLPALRSQ